MSGEQSTTITIQNVHVSVLTYRDQRVITLEMMDRVHQRAAEGAAPLWGRSGEAMPM